ncbi:MULTISPECIES: DUF1540 domain-containing protein [Terrisporobacter]|uniref:DUF1540 domain-containing protein n=1 Tax=Terrisporobacter muris TaxID=2963284 RepID=A0A9X2MDH9_9FIRM|nr:MULTISPECIES: DUF1540 domain-containing protein [Terrisporobacter]MCR1824600.1 DUF1540 domain-containing protein [Terrisporobacter muris]MDY3372547.1 DUF1540 domain-containing protein [Terrisporobacter othiniensis]
MKSTSLTCKATNCVHNKSGDCMAGVINVKGVNAKTISETICNTFVEEGGYAYDKLSNIYDNKKTVPESIKCIASNCKYNENDKCNAKDVQIMAARAACGTFELS